MSVDAFILSYKRPQNIDKVIAGIKLQSCIRNIYVFHNHPSSLKIPGVINIFSERNFGCIARYALALLSDCKFALFVDDDIALISDFSSRFKQLIRRKDFSVAGVFCRILSDLKTDQSIYQRSKTMHFNKDFIPVDIVTGRIHICRREYIYNIFSHSIYRKFPLSDDLVLNLSIQIATGYPSLAIPATKNEIKILEQNNSVHSRKKHYQERSDIVNYFIKIGWRPINGWL